MKRTLFTLLAALVASPAFAGNLNERDWTTLCDGEGHTHYYTFDENGNLIAHGGASGATTTCDLLYKSAHKMENGSSLAITLQFASTQGLNDFTVFSSHPDVDDAACLYVKTDVSSFVLKQWGAPITHLLTEASETPASLTLNFIVENDNLCYTYTFNGGESEKKSEKFTVVEGIDTSLAWQPCFSWRAVNATEVTVTDVTFSMVPEPGTATLSLLALAGLAARRRRATR